MHDFSQDAGIEQAQVVNGRNAVGQAFDQMQQRLQFRLGEQVWQADIGSCAPLKAHVDPHCFACCGEWPA